MPVISTEQIAAINYQVELVVEPTNIIKIVNFDVSRRRKLEMGDRRLLRSYLPLSHYFKISYYLPDLLGFDFELWPWLI